MPELFLCGDDVLKIRNKLDGKQCPRGIKAGIWRQLKLGDASLTSLSMSDLRSLGILEPTIYTGLSLLRPELFADESGGKSDE